ncbi:MAG: hypothetical protein RIQ92_1270, partial [Actinomycetota bacterium]
QVVVAILIAVAVLLQESRGKGKLKNSKLLSTLFKKNN